MKKNVVCYSLWGQHPMYWHGALENIKLVKKFYPGFIARFYIDNKCDTKLIETIKGDNVEVILMDSNNDWKGMFWRFLSAEDPDVDIFMSRDCDSRISEREVVAVNQWLKSDKDFHIMRDHPFHSVSILGGMWGCRNGILRGVGLSKVIESWNKFGQKGCDQDFLGQVVYPHVVKRSMEHSEFNLRYGGETIPFPTIRNNYEYVGDIFDENDQRHPEYWKLIKNVLG